MLAHEAETLAEITQKLVRKNDALIRELEKRFHNL